MIWLISTGCDAMTGLGVEARKTSVNTDFLLNSGLNFEPLGSSEIISLFQVAATVQSRRERFRAFWPGCLLKHVHIVQRRMHVCSYQAVEEVINSSSVLFHVILTIFFCS